MTKKIGAKNVGECRVKVPGWRGRRYPGRRQNESHGERGPETREKIMLESVFTKFFVH